MGCKRKIWFTKDGTTLEFDSFTDARKYFGVKTGVFPHYCVKSGWYKGWKVEAGDTPYHGMYNTSLYKSWAAMKTRCTNPNIPQWDDYGGRGIKICEAWMEFIPFMEWAKTHGHKEGLTIERIDVNGDYCPENCRWITRAEQALNTRRSRKITLGNVEKTLGEWSNEYSVSRATVKHRLDFGWSAEDAFKKQRKPWPKATEITYKGKTLSLRGWEKETGLNWTTIRRRLKSNWTVEDALTTPPDVTNRKGIYT